MTSNALKNVAPATSVTPIASANVLSNTQLQARKNAATPRGVGVIISLHTHNDRGTGVAATV